MNPDQVPWLTVSTAFVLALILPIVLLVIRHTVRRARAEIITEFERFLASATIGTSLSSLQKVSTADPTNSHGGSFTSPQYPSW